MNFVVTDETQPQTQPKTQPKTQTHEDDLNHLMDRMDTIERKLDLILHKLDGSIIKNCDKMGTHIDLMHKSPIP